MISEIDKGGGLEDLRRTNSESRSTMSVSIRSRIDGENDGIGTSFLGAIKENLGLAVV